MTLYDMDERDITFSASQRALSVDQRGGTTTSLSGVISGGPSRAVRTNDEEEEYYREMEDTENVDPEGDEYWR
jgi:hypothetical protein